MNTSNSKKLVAASDNQPTLRVEKEALLKVLVRELDSCTPRKVLQLTEQMVNEVIFESDVDGVHYYVVRCGQPTKLVCDEILLSIEQPNQTSSMKAEERINLSPREVAIAKLVARGLPNKSIAIHLHISPWTVATHLRRIFVKLGVTSRTAMITRLLEKNLLHD
jgi:two-component system, NarL family, nitrate/nitrite response regulator NarL